jgi:hypothetical protein
MSFESQLFGILQTACPRVFPDVAPTGTATPYLTWQQLGGANLRFIDNTAPDKRNVLLQINVWSKTRAEATALIRQIEDALCASALFVAVPEGEALSTYEADTLLYGSLSRFSIYATR